MALTVAKASETEKITINLGLIDLGQIDLLVREGFYSNRTDFIRTAIRNHLGTHAEVVRQTVSRKTLVLGLQEFTRGDLEAVKKSGKQLRIQVLGLARIAPDVSATLALATIESVSVLGNDITLYVSNMNVALLFVFAVIGIEVYGVIFGGWAANSKYAVLGSLRTCAQMISYEIPMGFAVIGVVMLAQSMSLLDIVRAQANVWNIVYQPVGFFVFFVAGLAESQRIPFDLAEAEGDLGAGFHTEYSGIRFAFFMVSEYAIMLLTSVLAVILFFGGWNGVLVPLPPLLWFLLKVAFFVYVFIWFRFTFPRYRYDQLMAIGWKVLLPLSMANIIVTGVAFL